MSVKPIDLTGQRFGRWTALSYAGNCYWNCRCECGKERKARQDALCSGTTKSCGCLGAELTSKRRTSHGHSALTKIGGKQSPEFRAWSSAKHRCYNPNYEGYHRYGGRGIEMCEEWRTSFEKFFAYIGERPSAQHSLDRYPDGDGNYEPGNVRWATNEEQQNNIRSNVRVEIDGKVFSLKEASDRFGLDYFLLARRLKKGWSPKRAIGLRDV